MIEYREFPLTQELMERLIAFSEDWAAEKSCTGYRANTPEDIEGNRVFLATDGEKVIAYLFGREYEFCRKFAPYVNNGNIEQLIAEMELAIRQVAQNGNPRILFPHFALTISKLIRKI